MKNLFNAADKQEIVDRINKLSANATAQWGKMDVAQMLKHCTKPIELAFTNPKPPRQFIGRILGRFARETVYGATPFKKNSFTPKEFKIVSKEDFDSQKKNLLQLIEKYTLANITDMTHPFFGKVTEAEWGESQYKHLDHHLVQFGV